MKIDAAFTKGTTHKICEDYAFTKNGVIPVAIISDGCSGSEDTDFGARLLTHCAISALESLEHMLDHIDSEELTYSFRDTFKKVLITKLLSVKSTLDLGINVFDATLGIIFKAKDKVFVYLLGDGFIILGDTVNKFRTIEVIYKNNAPYYITYSMDMDRGRTYADSVTGNPYILKRKIEDITNKEGKDIETTRICGKYNIKYDVMYSISFPADEYEYVGIASDGFSQFRKDGFNTMDSSSIFSKILNFRSFTGNFVQKPFFKNLKRLAKENIHPDDDVSLAVMYLKEDKE